jgi:hypothetical protein
LSEFLKEVGYNTSFLEGPTKNRGEVELWTLCTRALLNPLSLESKMFNDNIAPLKEEKLLWEQFQKDQLRRNKRNRDGDDSQ